jgi:hypothetical protein
MDALDEEGSWRVGWTIIRLGQLGVVSEAMVVVVDDVKKILVLYRGG